MPDLDAAARASITLGHMRALVDILEGGKPLTDKGNLKLADARLLAQRIGREDEFDQPEGFKTYTSREVPSVDLTYHWAKAAKLIRVTKNVASPTKRGQLLGRLPLEDVWTLFEAFILRLRWLENRYTLRGADYYAKDLWQEHLPEILVRATLSQRLELTFVAGDFAAWAFETYDFDDSEPEERDWLPVMVAYQMWQTIFSPLGELGIFELTGYAPPKAAIDIPNEEKSASLTPLGKWAVMRFLADWMG